MVTLSTLDTRDVYSWFTGERLSVSVYLIPSYLALHPFARTDNKYLCVFHAPATRHIYVRQQLGVGIRKPPTTRRIKPFFSGDHRRNYHFGSWPPLLGALDPLVFRPQDMQTQVSEVGERLSLQVSQFLPTTQCHGAAQVVPLRCKPCQVIDTTIIFNIIQSNSLQGTSFSCILHYLPRYNQSQHDCPNILHISEVKFQLEF